MKIIKFLFILFLWFSFSYFIFLFQPAQNFEAYINSLKPILNSEKANLSIIEKTEDYILYNLVIETRGKPLEAYIKVPYDRKNLPAVIILGGMMTGKSAVNYAYGVDNVILAAPDYRYKPRWEYNIFTILYDLLEAYEAMYMQVVDNILLIEYLNSWDKNEEKRISLLGYSFGVPFAIATVSVQKNINQLALVYGGADLKFLIRHNLDLFNFIIDELLVQLFWLHVMNFEPGNFTENLAAESILLVNGLQDKKIPELSAKKLQNNLSGQKSIIWLESKHVHPQNKQLSLKIIDILKNWYQEKGFVE